jgi:hypothetical protein
MLEFQRRMLLPADLHRDRIVNADASAYLEQPFGDVQAGYVPQIIGSRLER